MPIELPNLVQKGLSIIASAPPQVIEALKAELESVQPALLSEKTIDGYYSDSIGAMSREDFRSVVQCIVGLQGVQLSADVTPERFLGDILGSDFAIGLEPALRANLADRLPSLLAIKPLYVSAKAMNVLFDVPAHFSNARILSDVRPIFGQDDLGKIDVALISHTLRLRYHSTEVEELYITLDESDLDSLKEMIDRAVEKTRTMESFLSAAGVAVLKPAKE